MFAATLIVWRARSKRAHLKLSAEEIGRLRTLRDSRTAPWRETQRARILLRSHSGENVTQIAKAVGMTEDAKAWVVHLACSKPKDLGYAAEVWTRSALARHVREHASQAGYASLA